MTAGGEDGLRRARRLDWRFLLPDPSPGRVAYVGPTDPELIAALGEAGWDATVLDPASPPADPQDAGFDLVIVVDPTGPVLELALEGVRDGGSVSVEVRGWLGRGVRRRGRLGPAAVSATLRRARFGGIRRHLRLPAGSPRLIVPIDEPHALRLALARRGGGLGSRPVRAVLELLRRSGVLVRVAPAVGIVGRRARDVPGAGGDAINGHLAGLTSPDLPDSTRAPLLLTPRFRASRNVVALVPSRDGRNAEVVVKIARRTEGDSLTDREAAALRALGGQAHAGRGAPCLIDVGRPWGLATLVETAVPGPPLDPATVRADPEAALADGVAWLAGLARPDTVSLAAAARLDRLVLGPLHAFETGMPLSDDERQLVAATRATAAALRDVAMPQVVEHGDASHPNLIRRPDGGLAAVDWELAEPDGLPGHDLAAFLAYVAIARSRASSPEEQGRAIVASVVNPVEWADRAGREYARRIGLDEGLLGPLGVIAWARLVVWFVERLQGGRPDAVAPDTAAWLRGHRFFTAWRAAVEAHEPASGAR